MKILACYCLIISLIVIVLAFDGTINVIHTESKSNIDIVADIIADIIVLALYLPQIIFFIMYLF